MRVRLLHHDQGAQGWHYDWLLAWRPPTGPDDRCLLAWRVLQRPDLLPDGVVLRAEPLSLHRAFYLEVREPVELSQGRGRVTPVTDGELLALRAEGASTAPPSAPFRACIRWQDGSDRVYLFERGEGHDRVVCGRAGLPL